MAEVETSLSFLLSDAPKAEHLRSSYSEQFQVIANKVPIDREEYVFCLVSKIWDERYSADFISMKSGGFVKVVFDVTPIRICNNALTGNMEAIVNEDALLIPILFKDYLGSLLRTDVHIVDVLDGCLETHYAIGAEGDDWKLMFEKLSKFNFSRVAKSLRISSLAAQNQILFKGGG